ncbi:hypothetical protein AAH991_22250 [Microbispora sp. ZYX-F-249]|uniref:Uncharacterized protein n=1 Tax=Microbispora maris TaxID=3144104 RepID=A0ABV0ASQ3_9ACTN
MPVTCPHRTTALVEAILLLQLIEEGRYSGSKQLGRLVGSGESCRYDHGMPGPTVGMRIAGANLLGAVLGAAVSLILDMAADAGQRECRGSPSLCIGTGPVVGLAVGAALVVLGCLVGFAVLGIRPLIVSVPSGFALLLFTTWAYLSSVPGGRLHPLFAYAACTALFLGLLALIVTPGLRVVGVVVLAGAVVAVLLSGRAIHVAVQQNDEERALARLRVPLLAPDIAGYRLDSAYPAGDSLVLNLKNPDKRHWGAPGAIELLISPVPPGFAPPTTCLAVQPGPAINGNDGDAACQKAGPNRWKRSDDDAIQLIERRGDVLVVVGAWAEAMSLTDLGEVIDSLRPTTPAMLRAAVRASRQSSFAAIQASVTPFGLGPWR